MSLLSTGISALGKLVLLASLLFAFAAGMAGVVYMSLSGEEVRVPEIVGKDFVESERELAAMGLKIKKRADRPSTERINTVLEQLPKPGETVKTGQMILVVVSKAGLEGEEPKPLRKDVETDDSEKIEEMISDKPKRRSNSNTNANTRKRADTTRDVIANTATSTTNSASEADGKADDSKKESTPAQPAERPNRNTASPPTPRPQPSPTGRGSGEQRPRVNRR